MAAGGVIRPAGRETGMRNVTVQKGDRLFLAEVEFRDMWNDLVRVYEVTKDAVRFCGKAVSNDADYAISEIVAAA